MKSIFNWIGVAAVSFAILAGCTSDSKSGEEGAKPAEGAKPTAGTDKKDLRITMIAKSSTNPVFLSAHDGAKKAAEDIGKERGLNITVDIRTPADEDPQRQATAVTEAANEGVDAILISCSDAAKVTSAINEAVDKGVQVMTFDSDAPESKRFAFYGANDVEAGGQVLEELAKLNGGKGNIAILAGSQTAPNLQKRVQGVRDAMKKYPDMKEVGVFYHKETPQDAAAEVKRAMQANPEIDSWAMIGGWPLFTTTLLKDLDPAKVKVVAIDALPAQLPYIEAGIAPVLLAQPTYDWGYKSVGFIVDKLQGKPVETINKMELVRVSKDNLGQWANQLKTWGFKDVPEKYLSMK